MRIIYLPLLLPSDHSTVQFSPSRSDIYIICLFPLIVEKLLSIDVDENAEEYSGQFEGDIILSPEQIGDLTLRNGLSDEKYSWPNHTVVYEISADFDEERTDYIRKALDEMESVTCLKFIPRQNEESFIRVTVRNVI